MAATLAVLEYHLVSYRRIWRSSVLSSFVLPLLTMLGFGLGVGAYVRGGVQGVPYLDWLVPGLIASTAMQVGIGDSTWAVLGGFEWRRIYFGQAASPLRISEIVSGHLAYVLFRVVTSAAAFLVIAALFGTLHSGWAPAVVPIAGLVGLSVATPTFAYSATITSDSYLSIILRLGVLPMSLFSGVFFPVEQLPPVFRWIAYAFPLWHGVDLSRAATLGVAPAWPAVWHVVYLLGWTAAGWYLAVRAFARRLTL
jgi:lipooligosaccharide transport system permease protein